MNSLEILALFLASLGCLLMLALSKITGPHKYANKLLAALVGLSCIFFLTLASTLQPLNTHWLISIKINVQLLLLCLTGPLLYAYVLAMSDKLFRVNTKHWPHFLGVFTIILTLFFYDTENTGYLSWKKGLYYLHLGTYLGAALLILLRQKYKIRQLHFYEDGITLPWLSLLLKIALLATALNLIYFFSSQLLDIELWPREFLSMALILTFYYSVVYKAMTRPKIFKPNNSESVSYTHLTLPTIYSV